MHSIGLFVRHVRFKHSPFALTCLCQTQKHIFFLFVESLLSVHLMENCTFFPESESEEHTMLIQDLPMDRKCSPEKK